MFRPAFLLSLSLLFLLAVFAQPTPAAAKTPVILDTDIGDDIDDTWALVMILKSPELDLKLVTTTYGKNEYRAKIIAKLLTVAKRTDVGVGMGAGGRDGTAGQQDWVKDYKLADYPGKVHDDGVAAMIELIEKSPEPITLIAIGPCNTVAAALERKPEIAGKVNFFGMYGSVYKGYGDKKKPEPEWNVKSVVPAAKKVLLAPWKRIDITPLDTCGLVRLDGQRFQTLLKSDDPLVKALLENYRMWAKKDRVDQLTASSTLFDTAAVYLALAERPLVKMETLNITVTDDGSTKIDPAGSKMGVATEWQTLDAYHDVLVKVLTR
jgi:inosine-uridine nucleoside N-ribohydrolase